MKFRYMNEKEVALLYGISVKTLHNWRKEKIGPPFYKIGRSVRYRSDEVEEHANKGRFATK